MGYKEERSKMKCITICTYIEKSENSQINNLLMKFKALEKQKHTNTQGSS